MEELLLVRISAIKASTHSSTSTATATPKLIMNNSKFEIVHVINNCVDPTHFSKNLRKSVQNLIIGMPPWS